MKNKKVIYQLLAANTVSSFAQGLSLIAIPWYFTSILNKESFYIKSFIVITILTFILSLYSGTLIDRYSRKNLFLALNSIGFTLLISVAGYGYFIGEIPHLMIISVLAFALFSFQVHFPNLYAFGQEVVDKEHYGKFSTMIEIQNQSAVILSGALAVLLLPRADENAFDLAKSMGWDISPWAIQDIFLLNGTTYALAFILISRIQYTPLNHRNIEKGSVLSRFKTGWKYLKEQKKLFVFGVASHAVFVILMIHGFYLVNLYIDNYLHAGAGIYAISELCYSLGAMLSGFMVRKLFARTTTVNGIITLMAVAVMMCLIVGFTKASIFMILFQFLIGISNAGVRVLRLTHLMTTVNNDIMGRVESIFNAANILFRLLFLSLFSLTLFSEGGHVVNAYLTGAAFIGFAAIVLLWTQKE